ncbi:MAG: hypothetical protein WA865_02050 [Spirulinaceae cyanobacterium]
MGNQNNEITNQSHLSNPKSDTKSISSLKPQVGLNRLNILDREFILWLALAGSGWLWLALADWRTAGWLKGELPT